MVDFMASMPIAFFEDVQKLVFAVICCGLPFCNRLSIHGLCHCLYFVFHLVFCFAPFGRLVFQFVTVNQFNHSASHFFQVHWVIIPRFKAGCAPLEFFNV